MGSPKNLLCYDCFYLDQATVSITKTTSKIFSDIYPLFQPVSELIKEKVHQNSDAFLYPPKVSHSKAASRRLLKKSRQDKPVTLFDAPLLQHVRAIFLTSRLLFQEQQRTLHLLSGSVAGGQFERTPRHPRPPESMYLGEGKEKEGGDFFGVPQMETTFVREVTVNYKKQTVYTDILRSPEEVAAVVRGIPPDNSREHFLETLP